MAFIETQLIDFSWYDTFRTLNVINILKHTTLSQLF